jgi:predicted Na+-dependent transporter
MEKKKTSPLVYVVLIAIIIALGVFIFRRLQQNAEDRRAIEKIYPRAQ